MRMRYTVHGFSQEVAIRLGLDNDALLLLRWFVDFQGTGDMTTILMDGKPYFWVAYSKVIKDIPILTDKEDTVYRKFKKLCDIQANVLKVHTTREKLQNGKFKTYTYYGFGENYKSLISPVDVENMFKDSNGSLESNSEKNPSNHSSQSENSPSKDSEKNPSGYSEKNPYNIDLLTNTYSSIKENIYTHTDTVMENHMGKEHVCVYAQQMDIEIEKEYPVSMPVEPIVISAPKALIPEIEIKPFNISDLNIELNTILGEEFSPSIFTILIKKYGVDTVKKYMTNWDEYREHATSQPAYFTFCVKNNIPVPQKKKVVSNSYNNYNNVVPQYANFDQRDINDYSDENMKQFYANLNE